MHYLKDVLDKADGVRNYKLLNAVSVAFSSC